VPAADLGAAGLSAQVWHRINAPAPGCPALLIQASVEGLDLHAAGWSTCGPTSSSRPAVWPEGPTSGGVSRSRRGLGPRLDRVKRTKARVAGLPGSAPDRLLARRSRRGVP
jgi:hypothetical protein